MLYGKVVLYMWPPYLLMFCFLACKYKSLGAFSPLVIIPHYQIVSIALCIWNITPQWRTLTISLHELASNCSHLSLHFFLFPHSLYIYNFYQWIAFFSWLPHGIINLSVEDIHFLTWSSYTSLQKYTSKCNNFRKNTLGAS